MEKITWDKIDSIGIKFRKKYNLDKLRSDLLSVCKEVQQKWHKCTAMVQHAVLIINK